MIKTIKKIILSSLSILGISFLIWTLFLLNPSWSYAHKTQFEFVEVYHNTQLDDNTEYIIQTAIQRIQQSDLFNNATTIQLCMNDDLIYPNLQPYLGGPLAYATLNKTTLKNCTINFKENLATTKWAVNNYEFRRFDLTWLLAHEFTHNLQFQSNANYVIKNTMGTINWKLEGHAEYISRGYKNDGLLNQKIKKHLLVEQKEHIGIPVFQLEDGTKQSLSYFKYALVTQYLMEEKGLSYRQICELETGFDDLYKDMIIWNKE